jgi:hypothetical protein
MRYSFEVQHEMRIVNTDANPDISNRGLRRVPELLETLIIYPGNKVSNSRNATHPAFLQVSPQIYAKFFNKPSPTVARPGESSSSFHSFGFELLFWSGVTPPRVTSRVRHLKMDSRDSTALNPGAEERIRCP